jgi:predicted Fe-S protein YdhL (DUF1289 family)
MIASPCVNVCRMDPELGVCAGCLRTLDEIARWSIMRDEERARVVSAVAARRALSGPSPGAALPAASVTEAAPLEAHNHANRR